MSKQAIAILFIDATQFTDKNTICYRKIYFLNQKDIFQYIHFCPTFTFCGIQSGLKMILYQIASRLHNRLLKELWLLNGLRLFQASDGDKLISLPHHFVKELFFFIQNDYSFTFFHIFHVNWKLKEYLHEEKSSDMQPSQQKHNLICRIDQFLCLYQYQMQPFQRWDPFQ